ncbi:hypothetical protein B8V81_4012 [Paenibacillus pasadenensis]|uniref:Uncharacterized protein n=1 Tax=Paenibacillus pasadenensis TaxID=217090 RepID=A0A2N5N5F7_9BACL|nr:hypothetical protein B8V81_4012 [Paenibacillus pasadenensis]
MAQLHAIVPLAQSIVAPSTFGKRMRKRPGRFVRTACCRRLGALAAYSPL